MTSKLQQIIEEMGEDELGMKIILKYEGKNYECEGYAWLERNKNNNYYPRSGYEYDGVRNCEHDYASLLPQEVQSDIEFGCEQKLIEMIDYWYYDKSTGNKLYS